MVGARAQAMTEQYQQTNINIPRGYQYIDQRIVEPITGVTGLTSAVRLGTDARFIFCGGLGVAYNVLLPSVRAIEGLLLNIKNASGAIITFFAQEGEQINGNPTLVIADTDVAVIISDPADNISQPPVLPIGWTLFQNGAP